MTDNITMYHNPRCSKSRQTLQLLESRGEAPAIIDYLKTPPDAQTLDRLLTMLGIGPRELMRSKEAALIKGITSPVASGAIMFRPLVLPARGTWRTRRTRASPIPSMMASVPSSLSSLTTMTSSLSGG